MVGLAVRFDLGRFHATPWGAHVNDATVEWPPSPWRVLRALYAVSRQDVRLASRLADVDTALHSLAAARPPSYVLPPSAAAHTRHYMPSRRYATSRPGKDTDRVLDGYLALSSTEELEIWWDIDVGPRTFETLSHLAAALGYLGRSESVCTARAVRGRGPDSPDAAPLDIFREPPESETRILCLDGDGALESLGASVAELRKKRLLQPPGTRWVEYGVRSRDVASPPPFDVPSSTLAYYRLRGGSRPGPKETVAVTDALRAALQGRFGRLHGGRGSQVLSGRSGDSPRQDQHRHAHYLALHDPNGGRLDHLAVWAPAGFRAPELEALAGLTSVRLWDAPDPLTVALAALGNAEELRLPRLTGPARQWRSLTPFGLTRHPKRRGGREVDGPTEQIARELTLRGFPEPETVELLTGSWLEYRRSRPRASRLQAPRVVGAEVSFAAEVSGPIAIGALSHFGLGLFVPAP